MVVALVTTGCVMLLAELLIGVIVAVGLLVGTAPRAAGRDREGARA